MALSSLLKTENIILNLESTEKDELFAELTEVFVHQDSTINRREVLNSLLEREEQTNSCIKKGIAVTHAAVKNLKKNLCVLGFSRNGIDYDLENTYDEDNLVHVVVILLHDVKFTDESLQFFMDCEYDFKSDEFYNNLLAAQTKDEVLNIVRERENQ